MPRPNVILVFGDQWRAQAAGYAGDPTVKTPNLDRLASESANFTNAVAGCPVCSPYRASLLTGQYPLTHGVFLNDVYLQNRAPSIAHAFAEDGYDTAYVGKWHVDGHGRSNYIPPQRRQGFDYWKALECTHKYNRSPYYAGDSDEKLYWEGYDALAQTRDAQAYITGRDRAKPFFLVLSWGPPHGPYDAAPEEYRAMYRPDTIELRPNVPETHADRARQDLAGYYAHCSALDACMGMLLQTLREQGLEEDTVLLFTSDHGDMLGSQGEFKKQRPWDESIRVPFLLRYPALLGREGRQLDAVIDAPDVMPTLLGLCGCRIPNTVEGLDFSAYLHGGTDPSDGAALLLCAQPFGQWTRAHGGREYRGLRTNRYTYVRTLDGPWLLYDNAEDPYQLDNRAGLPDHARVQAQLDARLHRRLKAVADDFLPGTEYVRRWGYAVDATGTVPYAD
ncbi:MAG: sulfatase [Kiritimatiellae bacterium]|nr:sulfatase [Kiritimatiellia bacterium]